MTGHGGDEFLKFQVRSTQTTGVYSPQSMPTLSRTQKKSAVMTLLMPSMKCIQSAGERIVPGGVGPWDNCHHRYHEIFFMVDTCQAGTLANAIKSPNVVSTGSSAKGENSYAHHNSPEVCVIVVYMVPDGFLDIQIGVSVIDRFTLATLDFFERQAGKTDATLSNLFSSYNPNELYSNPVYHTKHFNRSLDETLLTDFFGSVLEVKPSAQHDAYPINIEAGDTEMPAKEQEGARLSTQWLSPPTQPESMSNPLQFAGPAFYLGVAALGAMVYVMDKLL